MLKLTPAMAHLRGHTYNRLILALLCLCLVSPLLLPPSRRFAICRLPATVGDHSLSCTSRGRRRAGRAEEDWRVYELVVRHFLASCSPDARGHRTEVEAELAGEGFLTAGLVIADLTEGNRNPRPQPQKFSK